MAHDKLTVYGVQGEIVWEDPTANMEVIEKVINDLRIIPDILVLTETFSTGFTNTVENCAESMDGVTVAFLKEKAQNNNMAICGSMVIKEKGNYYNRFIFVHPDGGIDHYDKRHLFTMSQEDKVYSAGNDRVVVAYKGWRILLQICYDLRFPVWSRSKDDYDLILYTANWPKVRHHVWESLLKARAIENQTYVFGLNRTGSDPNGIEYYGQSVFVDPKGVLMNVPNCNNTIVSMALSKNELLDFRTSFPVLNDRDDFELKI